MFRPVFPLGLLGPVSSAQLLGLRVSFHPQLQPKTFPLLFSIATSRPIHLQFSAARLESSTGNSPPLLKRDGASGKGASRRRPLLPPPRTIIKDMLTGYRNLFRAMRPETLKELWKEQPIIVSILYFIMICMIPIFFYVIWFVTVYSYQEYFCRYPEPLATTMRGAIWFWKTRPDPKQAAKYWAKALQQADELNLDPWSDEVMGIRLSACDWLDDIGDFPDEIRNLLRLRSEIVRWLEIFDDELKAGKITDGVRRHKEIFVDKEGNVIKEEYNDSITPENLWARRGRLHGRMIQISIKLADIYARPNVAEHDKAFEELQFAAETTLAEIRRQEIEGRREHEPEILNKSQIGALFERLAMYFMKKDKFAMAMPLLLQALPMSGEPCATSTVMANVSACFFQYPPFPLDDPIIQGVLKSQTPPPTTSNPNPQPPPVEKALRIAARNWSNNALELATETLAKGGLEDHEMDKCALCTMMATLNLGEIEEWFGNLKKAARRYETVLTQKGAGGAKIVEEVYADDAKEARMRATEGLDRVQKKEAGIEVVKPAKEIKMANPEWDRFWRIVTFRGA